MQKELYKQFILDLYRNPLNKKELEDFDMEERGLNPLCGDDITVRIKFDNDKIKEIGWQGDGCAISQAAVSLLSDELVGKSSGEVEKMTEQDIYELLGIEISYTRKKCANLGLDTIKKSLSQS